MKLHSVLFVCLNLFFILNLSAQTDFYIIKSIGVEGNKKTKQYRILREVQFKAGDTIKKTDFKEQINFAKSQIYNLALFTEVEADTSFTENFVDVIFKVKERWYIFPIPQLRLVDRSYQVWINTFNADLRRTTYGMEYKQYNFSGRADVLSLTGRTGFTKNLSFNYRNNAVNKKQNIGFFAQGGYISTRQIPFRTSFDNQPKLFPRNTAQSFNIKYAAETYYASFGLTVRNNIRWSKFYYLSYQNTNYNKNLIDSNSYFLYQYKKDSSRSYIEFGGGVNYINVDNILYPTKGALFRLAIRKRNLGFTNDNNYLLLSAAFNNFKKFNEKLSLQTTLISNALLPGKQPYFAVLNGNDEILPNGLNVYFLDYSFILSQKNTLRYKIFDKKYKLPFGIKIKALPNIPIKLLPTIHNDFCYAKPSGNFTSRLNNKLLYSFGPGLDIVTFYDLSVGLRYSFTNLDKGIFSFNTKLDL